MYLTINDTIQELSQSHNGQRLDYFAVAKVSLFIIILLIYRKPMIAHHQPL